jgi:DNA-binding transcriptional ArsR family regulator
MPFTVSPLREGVDQQTGTDRPEGQPVSTTAAEEDALYDVLANGRRRRIIACLAEQDGSVTSTELAEAIARRDAETAGDGERTDSIRASLYHAHLPKMDDAGVVAYDRDRETVRLVDPDDHPVDVRAFVDA